MANAKLQIAIEASNKAAGELKSLENDLRGVSSATNTSGVGFGKLVGAIGLGNLAANAASSAFNALGDFLKGTLEAAGNAEAGQAQLAAVLQSTGMAAGVTGEMANELATKMANLSTFTDDEVLSAENLMLTFTKVTKDVFPDAIQAALNVSTVMGQDLKSSVVQLGKALNNPIDGLTALTRVGVSFTDQQKKQIETLVETGKTMDAQKIILQELNREFGGSAAAAANTYQGKIKQLNNALGEVQENIGKAVLPALNLFVNDALSAAKEAQEATTKNDGWSRSFYSLASGAKAAGYVLKGLAYAVLSLGTLLVGGAIEAVAFASDVAKSFKRIGEIGQNVFAALAKAMTGDFAGAKESLAKAVSAFDLSGFNATVKQVNKTLGSFATDMDYAFIQAGQAMKEGVVQHGFKPIENAAPNVARQIMDAVGGGTAKAADKAKESLGKFKDAVEETQSKLADAIRDYTQKSNDRLDDHRKKVAEINAEMSQLQEDFAKSTADREKQYQDQRLDLFMAHQDKLTEAQKEFASLQKDLQNADDPDRRAELEARVNETKKQLDAEQAIVDQYASLKADAEKYRASNDLERLRLKHEAENLADKQAFDEKMATLKERMQEEEDEYIKQTERLKEETVRRFDELLKEYKTGYDKLIAESKIKQSELKAIQDQAEATLKAIQAARSAITSAPTGSAAAIPHLAAGGIVTRPTIALIGERGPEAVIPLNRSGGALGGQPVSVSILEGAVLNISNEADESRLARTVAKELAKVLQGNRFGLAAQM